MRKTIVEPLDRPFARAVVAELPTHKRVFVSGAVAVDDEGSLVGGDDLEEQTRATLRGIESHLATVGGSMEDVVRIRVYLNVNLDDPNYAAFNDGRAGFFPDEEGYPASTVVEVEGLVDERFLVEIEAEALVPDDGWEVAVERTGGD